MLTGKECGKTEKKNSKARTYDQGGEINDKRSRQEPDHRRS